MGKAKKKAAASKAKTGTRSPSRATAKVARPTRAPRAITGGARAEWGDADVQQLRASYINTTALILDILVSAELCSAPRAAGELIRLRDQFAALDQHQSAAQMERLAVFIGDPKRDALRKAKRDRAKSLLNRRPEGSA